MGPLAEVYVAAQARAADVLRGADPAAPVPATPGWTVRDLAAHLVGVAEDVVAGNVDAYAQDGWTAAQVARRAGTPVDELVDVWGALVPELAERVRDPGAHGLHEMYASAPVADLVVHELDLHYALGRPGPPPEEGVRALLPSRLDLLAVQVEAEGLPGIEVATEQTSRVVGPGPPAASVRGGAVDLHRSLHGRRTRDQVRAMAWEGDPDPYLPLWPGWVFSYPEAPIEP